MANKADRFYFETFVSVGEHACRAAEYIVSCLESYNPEELPRQLTELHAIEHSADKLRHGLNEALARAFVTPVDREDLAFISRNTDDVIDCLEEILQHFYMDGIKTVLPEAVEFARKLVVCCETVKGVLAEFVNFKKPAKLKEAIVKLASMEEQCDRFYLEAMLSIKNHTSDVLETLYWREIYNKMEECADTCEHVGECIATVVMKNS